LTPRPAATRRATADRRPSPARASTAAAIVVLLAASTATAQEPRLLEPERAFSFSARALDATTVETRFAIADGYYLYRDKLKFSLEPGALATPPVLPPGKVKQDAFFGNVETYRGQLVLRLALAAPAPGATVTVKAESQGCADLGVCYPPQIQKVTLALPAAGAPPGAPVESAPVKKTWFN